MPIRGKTPLIIFYYLSQGWKPKKIIEKGYKMGTVYKYSRVWKQLKNDFLKETGGI